MLRYKYRHAWVLNAAREFVTEKGWADSRTKCNRVDCSGPVLSKVERAFGEEEFGWSFPAESFSGAGIHPPGDLIELVLREDRQVGPPGQILAEQAVGVFADTALPGRVRMSEVHRDAGALAQALVMTHLRSLVEGHGAAQLAARSG